MSELVNVLEKNPPAGLLTSMAVRYDHSYHMQLLFETDEKHKERQERIMSLVEKIYHCTFINNQEFPLPPVPSPDLLAAMVKTYKENTKQYFDSEGSEEEAKRQDYMRRVVSQLYEEISGYGFYRYQKLRA